MENFGDYTNFVDDIDDVNFDNFLTKKMREKAKEKLTERAVSIRDMVEEQRRKLLLKERKEDGGKSGANRKTRATRKFGTVYGERLKTSSNPNAIGSQSLLNPRSKKEEMLMDMGMSEDEIDALRALDRPNENKADSTDAIIVETAPPSFFNANKKMIMIVGGLVVAGIVYFKFIRK
jgi:hypothetical protein